MKYNYFSYIGGIFLGGQLVPQIYKTWVQKNAENLSLPFLCCNVIGLLCMGMYGFLNNDFALVLPIAFSLCNTMILMFLKIIYSLKQQDNTL